MIKVSVTQHLINSEEEFIKELSKSEFSVPNEYSFENIDNIVYHNVLF